MNIYTNYPHFTLIGNLQLPVDKKWDETIFYYVRDFFIFLWFL